MHVSSLQVRSLNIVQKYSKVPNGDKRWNSQLYLNSESARRGQGRGEWLFRSFLYAKYLSHV